MNNVTWGISIVGIVTIVIAGCFTYLSVVESNNNKEVVTRAIERGNDPLVATCAANIASASKDIKSTCEKFFIIQGQKK